MAKKTADRAATAPIPWTKFMKLTASELTMEVVVAQLVGDREFPGLVLGEPDEEADEELSFEVIEEDARRSTNSSLEVFDGELKYTLMFLARGNLVSGPDKDAHKTLAKDLYVALRDALVGVLGKRTDGGAAKCVWELSDRKVMLEHKVTRSDRPAGVVQLHARPA